jgi:FtsP/CotA-like multicopper oxidase with cupredoxin domain
MERAKIGRREFIRENTVCLAAGWATLAAANSWAGGSGGMCGGGCGGGGGGTTIIDPPPGALFTDPAVFPNESAQAGVFEVSIEAKVAPINVNGVTANLLTYNGRYPAPTIRVSRGDLLRVKLTNSLSMLGVNILGHDRDVTNLHTHGLHVSPSGNSDNMMVMLMSGDRFTYEYDLSRQDASSINFYHPHIHGSVAEQYWGGMAGALEVEDELPVLSGYETHLLFLKDITLSGGSPAPYTSKMDYMQGKEGATVMVNGQVNPVLPIRPGQVQRWRIINACNARFFMLKLENHNFYVVGTEGGLLDKPYAMSALLLSPGERADVLVCANQSSRSYRLLALPYNRGCGSAGQQITLLTVPYQGRRVSDAVPAVVNPAAARLAPQVEKSEQLYLSMGQGKGYINGISFEMPSDGSMHAAEIHSMLGTYEIWDVINQSGMDHPFHQHVNPCQVLSVSGGDAGYAALYTTAPAWKDVVIVPKMGRVRLLVPVMDYDGMAMFHCHIVEHEDIGMMGLWHIMGEEM